jgi:hypothetical protein
VLSFPSYLSHLCPVSGIVHYETGIDCFHGMS